MYYVYILMCNDKRTYIGGTNDLKDRIHKHSSGYISVTKNRLPIQLHSYFTFKDEHTAFLFEQYLKSGSGRTFMKKHFLPKLGKLNKQLVFT